MVTSLALVLSLVPSLRLVTAVSAFRLQTVGVVDGMLKMVGIYGQRDYECRKKSKWPSNTGRRISEKRRGSAERIASYEKPKKVLSWKPAFGDIEIIGLPLEEGLKRAYAEIWENEV